MALTPTEGKQTMLVITPTAPPVTLPAACPVDWCPETGGHKWNFLDHPWIEPDRSHTLSVQDFVTAEGEPCSEVAVECYETASGKSQITVELFGGHAQLLNRDEVGQLVGSIRRAADLAFGPEFDHGADEFDAALKEVVERAANPTDVNRLVAAAIRFRKAYQAVDAELDAEEMAEAGK